jgi:hypothetical protein
MPKIENFSPNVPLFVNSIPGINIKVFEKKKNIEIMLRTNIQLNFSRNW